MSTALTTAQITDTRYIITDVDASDYILSDEQIENLWQQSSENMYVLYILCLQRIAGVYAQKLSLTDTFGDNRAFGNLFNNARTLLKYYSDELAKTGYAVIGGVLTPLPSDDSSVVSGASYLDLGIDVTDADDETGIVFW